MKYMLLIHQGSTPTPNDPEAWARFSEDEQKAVYADYQAINETPGVTPGERMQPPETATTVRVEDAKALTTDGPFVEIKEALGGYLFFEADNLDAAIELAARIPAARLGGAVEVRPFVERERSSSAPSAPSGDASSPPWSASSATSTSPRKRPRRPSPSPPSAGRARASRPIPTAGWSAPPATGQSTGCAASAT
jgi:hypothetical protein